ncbi:permease [Azotosporobacter soli]|uniref:permease n=1 Tax=Azotosporobacter soli TaxID=3055040 RepID=UPI0031FED18C
MFEEFANLVVYGWLGMAKEDHLAAALQFFIYDTPKILVWLSCAIFIISVLRSYISPLKVKELLGRQRTLTGHITAGLIGVATPFCSCSAVPLFIGLIEAGVPLGVTFSFLVASPMVNDVAVIMLWSLFGWKVALMYVTSGFIIAVLCGILIGKLGMERLLEEDVQLTSCKKQVERLTLTFYQRCKEALQFTLSLLRQITPYILVALSIGGFIHGYVPEDFLVAYAGRENVLAVPLVVGIGIPLYNSASGMVPIIYALMEKGLPVGTVLAFMMAVSAISFPEMIILRKVMKTQLIMLFAGILTVSIIVTGYLFNMLAY